MGHAEESWIITQENLRNTHIIDDCEPATIRPNTHSDFSRIPPMSLPHPLRLHRVDGTPPSVAAFWVLPHSPSLAADQAGQTKASPPASSAFDIEDGRYGVARESANPVSAAYDDMQTSSPVYTNAANDSSRTWPTSTQHMPSRTPRQRRKMLACCVVLGVLTTGAVAAIIVWFVIWGGERSH